MYSRDLIESLLKEADIVTVISAFIPVTKKGRGYVAICPFHDDKNPSLSISSERQIFKCFVCGTGGNAISFVQKYLGISYQDAVRRVAEIVGFSDERLEKEKEEIKVDKIKQPLFDTINDLQTLYQYCLNTPEGKDAQDYLAKRNIDKDQIKKYGIGYSFKEGAKTIEYLQRKGHTLDKIKDIGIVSSRSNSDANAGRLIFPLKDKNGQVVGFSARKIDSSDTESPKYVNSPDTKIFKKSLILYNYDNAKNTTRKDGYIYVLEGFMDVLALDKAGIQSAVALMGTSLSPEHIELLRSLNSEIRLCLDGDNPGQKGMMKIILQLNKANIPFRLVCNPNDLRDPDDILQESGPEELAKSMYNLVEPFEFQLNYYQNVEKLTRQEDKLKVLQYSLPFIESTKNNLDRENNIIKLSKITGYEPAIIREQLKKIENDDDSLDEITYSNNFNLSETAIAQRELKKLETAEKKTLYYMLQNTDAVEYFTKNIFNFYIENYEKIADLIVDYVYRTNEKVNIAILYNEIDQSEENDDVKHSLNEIIANLTSEEVAYEPYSEKNIADCAVVIYQEKGKISKKQSFNDKLRETPEKNKGELMKQYANSIKERIKK